MNNFVDKTLTDAEVRDVLKKIGTQDKTNGHRYFDWIYAKQNHSTCIDGMRVLNNELKKSTNGYWRKLGELIGEFLGFPISEHSIFSKIISKIFSKIVN